MSSGAAVCPFGLNEDICENARFWILSCSSAERPVWLDERVRSISQSILTPFRLTDHLPKMDRGSRIILEGDPPVETGGSELVKAGTENSETAGRGRYGR